MSRTLLAHFTLALLLVSPFAIADSSADAAASPTPETQPQLTLSLEDLLAVSENQEPVPMSTWSYGCYDGRPFGCNCPEGTMCARYVQPYAGSCCVGGSMYVCVDISECSYYGPSCHYYRCTG